MLESNALIVSIAICLPAAILASRKSTYLVDYLFFVVALNRGVRRFIDYQNGHFEPKSLISLTPIIVGGLATLVVLHELNQRGGQFGRRTLGVLYLYGLATAGAFVVGLVNVKLGAVYALGDYIAPIGLIGYGAIWARDEATLDRWCFSFAMSVLIVGVYGLWQFYTIPPWDGFWLVQSGMDGYMGQPKPTKMTLFSTLNERGPAAMYLCAGIILLALRPGTLGPLRFPAMAVIAWAMLLTYVRTTLIFAVIAILLYPVLNRGAAKWQIGLMLLIAIVGGPAVLARLPGQAAERVETLSKISEDSSFGARLRFLGAAVKESVMEPYGIGIGSHGMASRIAKAQKSGIGDSTGYIEVFRTFGWIGFAMITTVLIRAWRSSKELIEFGLDDKNVRMFRAWFIGGMVALFTANWLFTATFFWIFAGYCLGRRDLVDEETTYGECESD